MIAKRGSEMAIVTRYIGKPLKRKEDPRLVQGISHYVDDVRLVGMQHAMFLRSPYAHAKIRSIDLSKARTAAGVVLALSGADLGNAVGDVPCAARIPDMQAAPRPVLAKDRVRFVGEAVAVVVAADRYAARDALDLIEVD
jgi:aerobic carbon-monoxide dehydrogenase large subunit